MNYSNKKISSTLKIGLLTVVSFLVLQSCGINSNIMFKSPVGEYAQLDSLPLRAEDIEAYRIGIEDKLRFTMSTNNGAKLIEGISSVGEGGRAGASPEFVVLKDSTVDLPILGKVKVAGMTILEAEMELEKAFSKDYQDPFIQLSITNKRVIVFPGSGGSASVIQLENNNTTLMEVIAQAGGIDSRGKANTIKLIRLEKGVRKMYLIDLSTVKGLKYADIVLQANDYIYVEPKPELVRGIGQELIPYLSIFSTLLVIYSLIQN